MQKANSSGIWMWCGLKGWGYNVVVDGERIGKSSTESQVAQR